MSDFIAIYDRLEKLLGPIGALFIVISALLWRENRQLTREYIAMLKDEMPVRLKHNETLEKLATLLVRTQ